MPTCATQVLLAALSVSFACACGGKVLAGSAEDAGGATPAAGASDAGAWAAGGSGGSGGQGVGGEGGPSVGDATTGGQGGGGQSTGGQGAGGYTTGPDGTCSLPVGALTPGCPMALAPPCPWAQGGVTFGEFLCVLPFDSGPTPDHAWLDYVDVYFGSGYLGGGRLLRVSGAAACAATGNGWYFDNPQAPTKIHVCPDACACAKGQPGTFNIVSGCWANAAPGVLDATIPCPHCAKSRDTSCLGSPAFAYGVGLGMCELPLENGFDPAHTNVKYVQHGAVAGPAEPGDGYLTFVSSLADCDKVEEGWTLDSATQPPTIRVCPSACSCVKVNHASLMVESGCERHEYAPL